jgi:hypothetical protein
MLTLNLAVPVRVGLYDSAMIQQCRYNFSMNQVEVDVQIIDNDSGQTGQRLITFVNSDMDTRMADDLANEVPTMTAFRNAIINGVAEKLGFVGATHSDT